MKNEGLLQTNPDGRTLPAHSLSQQNDPTPRPQVARQSLNAFWGHGTLVAQAQRSVRGRAKRMEKVGTPWHVSSISSNNLLCLVPFLPHYRISFSWRRFYHRHWLILWGLGPANFNNADISRVRGRKIDVIPVFLSPWKEATRLWHGESRVTQDAASGWRSRRGPGLPSRG